MDFLKGCLEIDCDKRLSAQDLLQHPIFDYIFKHDFEKEFGVYGVVMPKKTRSKIGMLTPAHTPEPTSYMRIYKRKKSPHSPMLNKNSEESINISKQHSSNYKITEKSYLLPEIVKREELLHRKKSNKCIHKIMEIRTDPKSTMKTTDPPFNSRNLSLAHETSSENLVKSNFVNQTLSNRGNGFRKRDSGQITPDCLPALSFLPNKYRIKKHEELKITIARPIVSSTNNFSPSQYHK